MNIVNKDDQAKRVELYPPSSHSSSQFWGDDVFNDENDEDQNGREYDEIENIMPNFIGKKAEPKQMAAESRLEHPIEFEAKTISCKEEELMRKAQDLENEMKAVRQAKIDVIVR
jgi:hypothetical protein